MNDFIIFLLITSIPGWIIGNVVIISNNDLTRQLTNCYLCIAALLLSPIIGILFYYVIISYIMYIITKNFMLQINQPIHILNTFE